METKENMELYHKKLDGECIIMETLEETLRINENYIMFLEKQIKMTKKLLKVIKKFVEKEK